MENKYIKKDENPEFLNDYLSYSGTILNKSNSSIKEYNYDLLYFLRFLRYRYNGDKVPSGTINPDNLSFPEIIKIIDVKDLNHDFLKKITLEDIHAFLLYLKEYYQVSAPTIARKASSIRSFFKYETKIVQKLEINPAINLETPKLAKRLPVHLNLEESERLIEAAKNPRVFKSGQEDNIERNTAIITLFLNCGIRLSELIGINLDDIDYVENKITIRGKGNKEREIFLNKACTKSINEYLKVRDDEKVLDKNDKKALFLSERNKRISRRSVQYIVENTLKKAGINPTKYSTHKLRHTAATLMYQYGDVDIRALQKVLGHESIATTEIYTHINEAKVKEALDNNPLADL